MFGALDEGDKSVYKPMKLCVRWKMAYRFSQCDARSSKRKFSLSFTVVLGTVHPGLHGTPGSAPSTSGLCV